MMYTKIIDISWPVSMAMTAYKDNKTVSFVATKTFERDHVRSSLISMSSHTGTHLDAPSHFLADGMTAEKLDLDALIGPCIVLDLTHCVDKITRADLHGIGTHIRVLAQTKNSKHHPDAPFDHNFIALDVDAAQLLVERGVQVFGIDYLGVERAGQGSHSVHIELLAHNVCIIEGLRLGHVVPGVYTLCCLPLLLQGLDGSPARAVLLG